MQGPYYHQLRHFDLTLALVPAAQLKNRSISTRGSWTWGPRDGITQSESKSLDSTGTEMDPKVSMLVTQTDPGSLSP